MNIIIIHCILRTNVIDWGEATTNFRRGDETEVKRLDRAEQWNNEVIAQRERERAVTPLWRRGERPDGENLEPCEEIMPSMKVVPKDFGVQGGEMPNKNSTANVGDVMEMVSYGDRVSRSSADGDLTPHQLLPTRYAEVKYLASSSNESWGVDGRAPRSQPPFELETNIMAQGELNRLRESHAPSHSRLRLGFPRQITPLRLLARARWPFVRMPSKSEHVRFLQQSEAKRWMTIFQGNSKEDPARGVPQQCQGVKKEILLHLRGQLGVPSRAIPEPLVMEHSKSFLKSFALDSGQMASSGDDNTKDKLTGSAAHVTSNEGESHHSRDDPPQGDHSRDGSVEYIRTIKKEMRKVLPCLPDLTLLRLIGGKVRTPFLCLEPGSSISNSEMMKGEESKSVNPAARGVVIRKKHLRDKMPDILPLKKGKQAMDSKKKGAMSPLEDKKKGSSSKAPTKPKVTSSWAMTKATLIAVVPGEEISNNPRVVLGLNVSMIKNPVVAKKSLEGVIPPTNKDELAIELEGKLAELEAQEQHTVTELKRMTEDRNATMERLEKKVDELKEKEALTKKAAQEVQIFR
ncbi:hypothetical protein Acr_10g0010400 [Actinidia rufa]|uniref:Uncharacterized protein n=1 Tax=Actinidia rufa TaxID=165716 RepID=A0A7J0FAI1_9ERIC|nr:hypothetical protein Acr_10g0010400 [Actinidia rufa]